jgi:hypothetical protein
MDLQDKRLQKILELIFKLCDSHKELKPNHIISYLNDESCISLISELTNEEILTYGMENREDILRDCIKQIKTNNIKLKRQNIQAKIKDAQLQNNAEYLNRLIEEFDILMKERGKLNEEVRN